MSRVNVIYHHFPHYRRPVMRALARSSVHDYAFWGDTVDCDGVKAFSGDDLVEINHLTLVARETGGLSIGGYWPAVVDRDVDALIILGNANIRETWIIAAAGRLLGKKVLFWAHGWQRAEPRLKAWLRRTYYGLADGVLLYGHRAVSLATAGGFPQRKLSVIYNSLDWDQSRGLDEALLRQDRSVLRRSLGLPTDAPVLICSARLTQSCQFHLLIEAARLLNDRGLRTRTVLIGDGPLRSQLAAQAQGLGVDVMFTGAIYDEQSLARYYHAADLTVSPGKVGLAAIHSMTYGVPVITHDNPDDQMPESEAIVPGATGAFFRQGDAQDLAAKIEHWIGSHPDRAAVGKACRSVVRERYNPGVQARLIDAAVTEVLA